MDSFIWFHLISFVAIFLHDYHYQP